MEPILLISIITVIAVLLFVLEAFVVPGFGITGISACVCIVIADSLVYYYFDNLTAVIFIIASIALVLIFFWWVGQSKTMEKMSLHANIDSTNATPEQLSVQAGEEGVALTRLALIGNAEIGGKTVEVKSTGDFIDEGTPIIVTAVNEALILVKRKE